MNIDPRDVRDKSITFRPDSPDQKAAIVAAARDADMPASAWIRDLLVGRTRHQDVARRRAPQRPRRAREAETGNAPLVARVSAREKAAIERRAARAKKDVSEWARGAVAKELDRTGNVGPS